MKTGSQTAATWPTIARTVGSICLISTALAAALVILFAIFGSKISVVSAAIGWATSVASFLALAITIVKAFARKNRMTAFWAALGILKLGVIGVVLFFLVTKKIIEPIAFLAGFSTIVAALLVQAMRMRHEGL